MSVCLCIYICKVCIIILSKLVRSLALIFYLPSYRLLVRNLNNLNFLTERLKNQNFD
jgi:hypothetical protein